jgi:hypothetical protein
MIIAYIAYIQDDGEIHMLTNVPSNPPEDGDTTEDGLLIKHLLQSDLDTLNFSEAGDMFHEKYFWKNNSWTHRGVRPNKYYVWNASSEAWDKNSNAIISTIRMERNIKLGQSDWTQLGDSPLTEEKKVEWRTYRQQLRDIMENIPADLNDPDSLTWPTEPT